MQGEKHGVADIRFTNLTRAAEGLTQWRPLALGFSSLLLAVVVAGLGQWIMFASGGFMGILFGGLFVLLAMVIVMAGSSGVGAMLMDKAQQLPMRGFAEAAIFGLLCLPKFIGFSLLVGLAGFAFAVLAAIVYFVCKIPFIGAILAFVVHPVLIVVAALLIVGAFWVVFPLFAPAVWSGLSITQALSSVIGIARSRLVPVVLMQLVLYFIVGLIGALLAAGLLPAGLSLTAMGAGVIGASDMMSSMGGGYGYGYDPSPFSMMAGMLGGLMDNGSLVGLFMGVGVLGVIVTALMAQVVILGLNLVYIEARDNLDTSDTEMAMGAALATMRQRAAEAKERAKALTEQAKEAATQKAKEAAAAHEARKAAAAEQAQAKALALAAQLEAEEAAALKAEAEAQAEAQRRAEQEASEAQARQVAEQQAAQELERERELVQAEAERLAAQQAAAQAQLVAEEKAVLEAQTLAAEADAEAARLAQVNAAQERAQADATAAQQNAANATEVITSLPSTLALGQCPKCQASVTPSDRFCGECGHKLQ